MSKLVPTDYAALPAEDKARVRASAKLQPPVGETSRARDIVILARCQDPLEREFFRAYRNRPKVQLRVAQTGCPHNPTPDALPRRGATPDGSRGFQPTEHRRRYVFRRGATVEPHLPPDQDN